jgi:hypothetical protein
MSLLPLAGQVLGSWESAFGFSEGSGPEAAVKARISDLERITGKQAVKIEILKEISE